jgi:hypothetical protein
VGVAVTDLLRERRLGFMPVTIHGGHNTTRDGGAHNVPKTDLVAAIEVPFRKDVLRVASGLKLWPTLRHELLTFKRKQNTRTAHISYEHWRETEHDYLVLAAALA